MNFLSLLFAASVGVSPVNDDVLRDINAPFFTDIECSATFMNTATISGGIRTDSKYSHKTYFKPVQDKYELGLSVHRKIFEVGIHHYCRHPILAYDSIFDRYDISKSLCYASANIVCKSIYVKNTVGICKYTQRYSFNRAECGNGYSECVTYFTSSQEYAYYYNFTAGIYYKRLHIITDNSIAPMIYNSLKNTIEYNYGRASLGCMYEWTYESRVTDKSYESKKLHLYIKINCFS